MKQSALKFRRSVLARSVLIACGAGAAMFAPQSAMAQADTSLQRVEITGSAVRRTDAEAALHVQVLTKEDIARTGATSTEQLLQSISALSSAGSVNSAMGAGLSTYGASSISLRGLEESDLVVALQHEVRVAESQEHLRRRSPVTHCS